MHRLSRTLTWACTGLATMVLASSAFAQWIPTGVPICGDCHPSQHASIPDGEGGAYVLWTDQRDLSTGDVRVYLQRITGQGTIAPGWPADGLPVCVCSGGQRHETLIADEAGGVYVVWFEGRNSETTSADLYAQRVRGDGTLAPGWPEGGMPLSRDPGYQSKCAVVADGTGGLFAAWEDQRTGPVITLSAQHLSALGQPLPGWLADGVLVCSAPSSRYPPQNRRLIADGSGGVMIVWDDNRRYPPTSDIHMQHLLADGSIAPGWPVNGRPLLLDQDSPRVLPDETGGFYVGSVLIPVEPKFDIRFSLQRFTIDGEVAPGWPAEGVAVCTTPGYRIWMDIAADGVGGVLMNWLDYRSSTFGTGGTYALRVRPDGTLPPGWTADGMRVSDATLPFQNLYSWIAPDGVGGAYVGWEHESIEAGLSTQLSSMQHLSAAGQVAPGWPVGGRRLAPSRYQDEPSVVSDDRGGAIVIWEERDFAQSRVGLFAQRFEPTGPVAAELALASAEASAERVVLRWHGAGAGALAASVERRGETQAWRVLGVASAEGPDVLRFEDHDVEPGGRRAYRLVYEEGGVARQTRESWVEVPRALRLALEGFSPNPAVGEPRVMFTLASYASGSLEVLDLAGRRMLLRDVSALGPGRHALRLDDVRLAPGVYVVRLQHAGELRLTRAVMVE